jgi:alpha-N-arabinofuranosidase
MQVKYWALGNEVWGPWQVEQTTKEEYAHKAYQWAKGNELSATPLFQSG